MWTPRRIVLLVVGFIAFGAAYVGYNRLLGDIDGLPNLPVKFLEAADGPLPPTKYPVSPTIVRLRHAFGPNSPESERTDIYPTRLEQREDGIVFACGRPDFGDGGATRFVKVAPFSMAQFARPRSVNDRLPDEVPEVTTMHADECIMEFDQPISLDRDMVSGRAKIVGIELKAVPNPTARTDARNGRVLIINNQRSADANNFLVFKTPGPVFYRTAEHPELATPNAPHIRTDAVVEIVNRENQPRPLRGVNLPSVPVTADDALRGTVIADMALGLHTPPPTVTAEGMHIFLRPQAPPTGKPDPKAPKRTGTGFAGVRELVLLADVEFNFWSNSSGGFPGGGGSAPDASTAPTDPLAGLVGLGGGLVDGLAAADRLAKKSLVRIRTLGPFYYNWETNAARFEIATDVNPLLPNNVEVTRQAAVGGRDHLVCQKLLVEFNGPLGGTPAKAPAAKTDPKQAGPTFKKLVATGSNVYLAAEGEQLQAFGTELIYDAEPTKRLTRTTLRGVPLVAVKGGNRLTAGVPEKPGAAAVSGLLVLETVEPPPVTKQPKTTTINVLGPGKIDLFDAVTRSATVTATWRKALYQAKEKHSDRWQDVLVFTGGGQFIDAPSGFDLKAETLKLWLEPGPTGPDGKPGPAKPARLQGLSDVVARSDEMNIKQADELMVWFVDGQRPPPPAGVASRKTPIAPTIVPVGGPLPPSTGPQVVPAPFQEPTATVPGPKPKPTELSARRIESWVTRYPVGPPQPDGTVPLKYELDRAVCTDRVQVHQEPNDPATAPVGLKILGDHLTLENAPGRGHKMVVTTAEEYAFVQFENTIITGPKVTIDQPNNAVQVAGKGKLKMPSSSDLSGTPTVGRNDFLVEWTDRMTFFGERRSANFLGDVKAVQQPADATVTGPTWSISYVICHVMDVTFDRPIYFNQFKTTRSPRTDKPKSAADNPNVERVLCEPQPDDATTIGRNPRAFVFYSDETVDRTTGKHVKAQRITSRYLDVRVSADRTLIEANGPGESRGLQKGAKDAAQSGPPSPAAPTSKPDEELKLTVVKFKGRLTIEDKKQIFQKAVFTNGVRAFHFPTDNLDADVIDHLMPERGVILNCTDRMTATAYRNKAGEEDRRTLEALGDATVKTEEYEGKGYTIEYEEPMIVLRGHADGEATLYRRRTGVGRENDFQSGNPLTYNRRTGDVRANNSSGGTYSRDNK